METAIDRVAKRTMTIKAAAAEFQVPISALRYRLARLAEKDKSNPYGLNAEQELLVTSMGTALREAGIGQKSVVYMKYLRALALERGIDFKRNAPSKKWIESIVIGDTQTQRRVSVNPIPKMGQLSDAAQNVWMMGTCKLEFTGFTKKTSVTCITAVNGLGEVLPPLVAVDVNKFDRCKPLLEQGPKDRRILWVDKHVQSKGYIWAWFRSTFPSAEKIVFLVVNEPDVADCREALATYQDRVTLFHADFNPLKRVSEIYAAEKTNKKGPFLQTDFNSALAKAWELGFANIKEEFEKILFPEGAKEVFEKIPFPEDARA